MFRPSDVRRVQAAFDDGLDAPYEAQVVLEQARKTMRVTIMDPDEPSLPVGQAVWWFDESAAKSVKQPSNEEIAAIVDAHRKVCDDYPVRKATEAIETAARVARQAANMAARAADEALRTSALVTVGPTEE